MKAEQRRGGGGRTGYNFFFVFASVLIRVLVSLAHMLFAGSNLEAPYELNAENRFLELENPFEEGVRLFEEGQIADAVLCFEAEIARNPENSQVKMMYSVYTTYYVVRNDRYSSICLFFHVFLSKAYHAWYDSSDCVVVVLGDCCCCYLLIFLRVFWAAGACDTSYRSRDTRVCAVCIFFTKNREESYVLGSKK